MSAFEDMLKSFKRIDDENSAEFKEHAPMMKKLVSDANAAAQSKGIEVVLVFAEAAAVAPKFAAEIADAIVDKCLTSPKTSTKAWMHVAVFTHLGRRRARRSASC